MDQVKDKVETVKVRCTPKISQTFNLIACLLIVLGILLRYVLNTFEDTIGKTPILLFHVQALASLLCVFLVVAGEFGKPQRVLGCFPLLCSRTGRSVIVLMVSIPLTNFTDFYTAVISIFCSCVGLVGIVVSWQDPPVELTLPSADTEAHPVAQQTAASGDSPDPKAPQQDPSLLAPPSTQKQGQIPPSQREVPQDQSDRQYSIA